MATQMERFIRDYARSIGIDPDIAMRVALSEGGQQSMTDVTRRAVGTEAYGREESYGPFQLHMRGGLGAKALAAGIDPRKPEDAYRAVKFALDQAKAGGWGPWHGWKGDSYAGISRGTTLAGVPGNIVSPPVVGTSAPLPLPQDLVTPDSAAIAAGSTAAPAAPKTWMEGFKARLGVEGGGADLLKGITGKGDEQTADPLANAEGNLSIADDSGRYQAAQALMAAIMAGRKNQGLTLTSTPIGASQWPQMF
jgi:hypothetical protein